MGSFWFIVSICGIAGQFFVDYLIKNEKWKIITGILVMIFTVFALWTTASQQEEETNRTFRELSQINTQYQNLQKTLMSRDSVIGSIRSQYDSIRHQNIALQTSLSNISRQQNESYSIGQKTVEEVSRSREAIESIRQKGGGRLISTEVAKNMIPILRSSRGKVSVAAVANNPDANSLKVRLISLLKEAGWDVTEGLSYFTMPPRTGITILVKGTQYPKRVEKIVECLNLCNLKWAAQYDDKLQEDDISIMVDH